MSKGYYVVQNSGMRGPLTAQEIRGMAERGELKPDDGIRQVGQDQVHPAASVAGLFSSRSSAAPLSSASSLGAPRAPTPPTAPQQPATQQTTTQRSAPIPSTPFASSKPAATARATNASASGGAGQGGGGAISGPRHPVTDLLTTLVLLQLEDLSARVERGEITEQRYQERSSLLFAQLRGAEAALLAGGTTGLAAAGFSSGPPSGGLAYGAPSPHAGHPDHSPAAGGGFPSTLALGAAALGGGALGYVAARSGAASGGGSPGSMSIASGLSGPAARGFSPPSGSSGLSAPTDAEPSLWNDLIGGSQRLASGWKAWRGVQSIFGNQTPNAASGSGNLSPSSMASHFSSPAPSHASPEQFHATQPFDAQPIDVQPLDTEGITDAELVDAGHDSLGSQMGNHFSPPPVETPHVEQTSSWFGGESTPEPDGTSVVETDGGGWFGTDDDADDADGGDDWFGGGSETVSEGDAGGDWFGGSTDVGLDVGGGDAGVDLGDVDLSGFDGGGFEF